MGAASLALLGLAELVLPALLEQRGVGWSGPLLTGMAVGGGLGAFVHGLRSWPRRLRTRSVVLMAGTSACVALAALTPHPAGLTAALVVGARSSRARCSRGRMDSGRLSCDDRWRGRFMPGTR